MGRMDLLRPHLDAHFNEISSTSSTYRGVTGVRKCPPVNTFGGTVPPQHQQFRGTVEHAWIPQQPSHPPSPPSKQPLRSRSEVDPLFPNFRLLDSAPSAFREQGKPQCAGLVG